MFNWSSDGLLDGKKRSSTYAGAYFVEYVHSGTQNLQGNTQELSLILCVLQAIEDEEWLCASEACCCPS